MQGVAAHDLIEHEDQYLPHGEARVCERRRLWAASEGLPAPPGCGLATRAARGSTGRMLAVSHRPASPTSAPTCLQPWWARRRTPAWRRVPASRSPTSPP